MVWSDTGNINIFVAVVIVVGDCDSDAVHLDRETCLAGNIRKRAILIVVIKRRKDLRFFARASPWN